MRIQHELTALSAGGVQVQAHPAAGAVVGRDGLLGAQEEAQVFAVVLDFDFPDGVALGAVVVHAAGAFRVTGEIAVVEGIVHRAGFPEASDRRPCGNRQAPEHRRVRHALVAADILNQLHEVVVEVPAAHHFQIAAVLVVCAVHKHEGALRNALPAPGNPLVPARHQHDGRVGFDGAVKLLGEIEAFFPCVRRGVVVPVVEGSAAVAGLAVQHRVAEAQLRVLRHRHVDDLRHALQVGEHALRAGEVHPRPAAQLVRLVRPLGHLDIEEIAAFGGALCLHRDDDRLAVQAEPCVAGKAGAVDFVVNLLHGLAGGGVGVEHDLRNLPALIVVFLQNAHDQLGVVLIYQRIGRVEEQEVDVRLHDELHVVAHDPFIVRVVVAVERFAPVVVGSDAAPDVAVRLVPRLRVCRDDFGHVVRLVFAALAQPKEVEQPDQTVAARGGNARGAVRSGASQRVGRHEGTGCGARRILRAFACMFHEYSPFCSCIMQGRLHCATIIYQRAAFVNEKTGKKRGGGGGGSVRGGVQHEKTDKKPPPEGSGSRLDYFLLKVNSLASVMVFLSLS